jgi:tetratricopeptide (TPR) repeat protein
MKHFCAGTIVFASCFFASFFASSLQAAAKSDEPETLQFLHKLQQGGFGDMAVDYLKTLKEQNKLPAALTDVFDLEMSESLRAAANVTYDEKESDLMKAESRKLLEKFLKEHADHPAADAARAAGAEYQLKETILRLQLVKPLAAAKDKEGKAKYEKEIKAIRDQFGGVRSDFTKAYEKFQEQAKKLPDYPEAPAPGAKPVEVSAYNKAYEKVFIARDKVESNIYGLAWQIAMIKYHLAQSYLPKSKEQTGLLNEAKSDLDKIYQTNRTVPNSSGRFVVALLSLLWEGKISQELGNSTDALDIYEEVLACAPDSKTVAKNAGRNDPMEVLYTQVAFFRFQILAQKKPRAFLEESLPWLKEHDASEKTEGYQGVALETAKSLVALSKNATSAEKRKALELAKKILKDMIGVASPYHQEAVQMRRGLLAGGGSSGGGAANTYEDAVAEGDAFLEEGQAEQARDAYKKALQFAEKKGVANESKLHDAIEGLCKAQLRLSVAAYKKKNYADCLAMLDQTIYSDAEKKTARKDSPTAAVAASFAVNVALQIYADAPQDKRAAALADLQARAKAVEDGWPTRPEADDARMALARVQYSLGKVREAVEVFDKVNPQSERYPMAMYRAGQIYASLYWEQKKKGGDEAAKKESQANLEKAVKQLNAGLEVLNKRREPGKPLPENFVESQILLGSVYLDSGDMKNAAAAFQTLIDIFREEKRDALDDSMVSVFRGAVQAYASIGDVQKAGEVGEVLLNMGPDKAPANAVLIDFARRLDFERKKIVGAVTELEAANKTDELKAARDKQASLEKMLGVFLDKLAKRQEISLGGMMFLGDALSAVGKTNEAGDIYKKILNRAQADPDFAKSAARAVTSVRAKLVGLLRQQRKFAEALKECDELLKAHPRALEPLMERGQILEGLSQQDPTQFSEAVAHWAKLRGLLQNMRPTPPEYYEVIYHVAWCLMSEANQSKDPKVVKDRANTAEKVLKSTLFLNPKLNGPDMVAKYKVLLSRAITMQGRSPDAK